VEADFRAAYGIDLAEVCFGSHPWGLRKLYAHVRHLGPSSATARHLDAGWSTEDELLATVAEISHASLRAFLAANGAKRVPDQIKIPRPSGSAPEAAPPPTLSLEGMREALLGGSPQ
jgi:hypothetical protein